jgi:hypothetical protein
MDSIGRRDALGWLGRVPVWAALALAAIQQACMGDATTKYPMGGAAGVLMACPAACDPGGKVPMMDMHCHPTCLSAAELGGGVDVPSLALTDGGNGHTHTVALTAAQLTTLNMGGSVTITSTPTSVPIAYDNHTHTVKFG